ncbi:hypothetical protein D3C84_1271730 [compost metagenome]
MAMSLGVLLMLPEVDDISTSCGVPPASISPLTLTLPALPTPDRLLRTVLV